LVFEFEPHKNAAKNAIKAVWKRRSPLGLVGNHVTNSQSNEKQSS
jgi:hypothetical protein